MATYFVTGGNGFVGSHVVDHLVEEGHRVLALVRNPDRLRFLRGEGITMLAGDLGDGGALKEGAALADVVIHTAALTKSRTEEEMMRVNVEGTRRLLQACLARETPPAFVFVSSQAAGGPSMDGEPVDETVRPHPLSTYGRSKLSAEELVLEQAERLPVAVVRPPAIYGPRDQAFLFLFKSARAGWLPRPTSARRLSLAHVDDVVRGIRLAERGHGVYYVSGGEPHALETVLETIARAAGREARVVPIPAPVFVGAVWLWEKAVRLFGKLPPLTADRALDAIARDWICSDRRAREELGYRPRWTLPEGMTHTAAWYTEKGWLAP